MKRKAPHRFAVCIDNVDYPASLEMHKIYRILPDDDAATDGDVRVIDESGGLQYRGLKGKVARLHSKVESLSPRSADN